MRSRMVRINKSRLEADSGSPGAEAASIAHPMVDMGACTEPPWQMAIRA
jgi:hypothetical protein